MKIALIGYGNMGKEIDAALSGSPLHTIVSVSLRKTGDPLDTKGIAHADVAIDFTSPEIVLRTIPKVLALNTPLVVGTTGWYGKIPWVQKVVKKYRTGLIYGQNFSVGANIYFSIVRHASALFNQFQGYDVFGVETHHTGKKDSPSGTARKLAEIIIDEMSVKKQLQINTLERKIRTEELHFASVRGGRNFGRHEVIFDSAADEVHLIHQAAGRRGFAEGAIMAASYIQNRKGMYNFSDIFVRLGKKQ